MTVPVPHSAPAAEIARLAERQRKAGGPVMAAMLRIGGSVEKSLAGLPDGVRKGLDGAVRAALWQAASVARLGKHAPDIGPIGAPLAAAVAGAAGGAGGIATAVAELPVTITLILHAIAGAARDEGFDPDDPWVRAECLKVLSGGSPADSDDGIDTALIGARLTLNGPALQKLIATIAPRLATALGQKLAAQSVPVLGAVSGAAINAAFLNHYRELARIRFALLRLVALNGSEAMLPAFRAATAAPRITRA